MDQLGSFHHIGLACRVMADEYDQLEALGYSAETSPIADPIQKVRIRFFTGEGHGLNWSSRPPTIHLFTGG